MKKNILKTTVYLFLLMSLSMSAQDFQGQAYYQTQRKVDLKIKNSQISNEQQAAIQQMMKKQFEKTYILTFNKETSLYKEEEGLEKPTQQNSGIRVMVIGKGSGQKLFKNTKAKTFTSQQDVFGKTFLIKDNLKSYNWKLENESKIIGKYLCFKATFSREMTKIKSNFNSTKKDSPKTQIITAWYTTDIPVNHGPDKFWGLPGLILELNEGDDIQYVCTKIVMNTKNRISEPEKGKLITQKEYEAIMKKKSEEMIKNRGREGNGNGQIRRINIGS